MYDVTLTLVDLNPKMIAAWQTVFDAEPGVEIVRGSLLDERVSAWVSPTNSRALMDGGLDGAIRARLGAGIQARFRCRVCGSTVEERTHCAAAAERVSGWGPMDNNAVNLVASALGVAFAWILLRWFGGGL